MQIRVGRVGPVGWVCCCRGADLAVSPHTDAILGTSFFADSAPSSFGRFDLAMVSIFQENIA